MGGFSNEHYRGSEGAMADVHDTNFYEFEGHTRVNPAAGMELDEAVYDNIVFQVCVHMRYVCVNLYSLCLSITE